MERYRFHSDGALFYVTFSVVDWLPIFVSEAACKIVTESLNFCHRQKGLRINAYVIMPTHMQRSEGRGWRSRCGRHVAIMFLEELPCPS